MQKWDYLFIVVDKENLSDLGHPRYVNGQELPNWEKGQNIFEVMNYLCWKGWELVSFGLGYPFRKELRQPMIYRRPKA